MKYAFYAFVAIFFVSCAAPYTQEDVSDEFKIDEFKNSYSLNAQKTDSIFDVFKDDELINLTNIALKNNSDVLIYANRIKIAESQARLAINDWIPKIDGELSYSYSKDSKSVLDIGLMASWELDIFGKYASLKDSYDELYEVARQNLADFQISLISDIALAYFNIKYLQHNIILTRERIKNYQELVQVMDVTYKNGLSDFSTFLENKTLLQEEQQELNTLLNTYEEKKNELRLLINDFTYDFDDALVLVDDCKCDPSEVGYKFFIPNFHANLNDSVNIILNRPDVRAYISSLNSSIHELNAARAEMYPTISLSGSLSKTLVSPSGVADLAYQILASLTLPIFSRMEIYENIKIADFTRLEAYYTLQKGIYTALGEIENAILALDNTKSMLSISLDMLDDNTELLELLHQSYSLGLIDFIEYITALNYNLSMIKNNNVSYYDTISATIYLYRVVGGNSDDIAKEEQNEGETNEE